MKKFVFLTVFLLIGFIALAKVKKDPLNNSTSSNPKVQVTVHKVYNQNGDLVKYDSTYTWSYHTGNQATKIDVDSLFHRFLPYFHQNFPDSTFQTMQNNFFDMNDSAMILDFFNNNHFFDQWHNKLFNMQKEFREMDSLKSRFLKRFLNEKKLQNAKPKAGIY